jgi:YD repeat-containing protein
MHSRAARTPSRRARRATRVALTTDNATGRKASYTYDSQERLSYALEADSAGTRTASWLDCWDKAGNLTSQDGTASTCPGSAVFNYNDASELTSQTGSATPWSYDKTGNETAGGRVAACARTNETWADHSQLSGITQGGTSYDLVHAGTDNSERTKLGSTWFHHTALGLASTTTNGVDTGFIRESGGTLNSCGGARQRSAAGPREKGDRKWKRQDGRWNNAQQ